MAADYDIPDVSYGGDAPDPVEWANGFVKPAITDLDSRVTSLGPPPNVQIFDTPGVGQTWTKPPGVSVVHIVLIGGGGGGGGGRAQTAAGQNAAGGGGGGGGGMTEVTLPASALTATCRVDVGGGGIGGAAATGSGNGGYGSPGGQSSFSNLSPTVNLATSGQAQYGEGARPGFTSVGGSTLGGPMHRGGFGGSSPDTDTPPTIAGATTPGVYGVLGNFAAGAGGAGGNVYSTNALQPGTNGGSSGPFGGGSGSGDSSFAVSFYGPIDGANAPVGAPFGGGGGGGGSFLGLSGETGRGGHGGRHGGGGGGGSANVFGSQGTAGGNGGPGVVIVMSW